MRRVGIGTEYPAMRIAIDLDPATVRRLSDRARRHGRSIEDEARAMLDRDASARGPGGDAPAEATTDELTTEELLAGFERFRRVAPEPTPSLATLRRLRERARVAAPE